MGSVTIDSNLNLERIKEDNLKELERELSIALQDEKAEIDQRTQSGLDVDGRPFKPYSAEYLGIRQERGYSTKPNLTVTGNMLKSLTTSTRRTGDNLEGKIYFASATEAEKARGNMQKRRFFGLSDEQIERIRRRLISVLKD